MTIPLKRDLVGLAMKVAGLAKLWDSDDHVRTRCREHRRMNLHPDTQKWCEPTRANCVTNAMIILPCLDILGKTKGYKLPHLEQLQVEIEGLFQKMRLPLDDKMIYRSAAEIKKMLGFVKRRANKKQVTKDCHVSQRSPTFLEPAICVTVELSPYKASKIVGQIKVWVSLSWMVDYPGPKSSLP